jgi:diketogulonate reductase-like aldo/keto reductase
MLPIVIAGTHDSSCCYSPEVIGLAKKYQRTPEQIFFRFVQFLGIIPLSGTRSEQHMKEDLAVSSMNLAVAEYDMIQRLLR